MAREARCLIPSNDSFNVYCSYFQQGGNIHPEDKAQAALPRGFPFAGPGGLEAAAMRAFSAALDLPSRALEPGTDFWSAGGDSLAAVQVTPPALFSFDILACT